MTEGAIHVSTTLKWAPPLNPWNTGYWSWLLVDRIRRRNVAGALLRNLGSDTGGSIRFPSATCGLSGIKPTWGRVSRYGVFPLADTLDYVGP